MLQEIFDGLRLLMKIIHCNLYTNYKSYTNFPTILGAVWYVSLKEAVSEMNGSDDDDEVLTKLDRNSSLLHEVERDESIRHVDSDVDSDNSEISELNTVSYSKHFTSSLILFCLFKHKNIFYY